MERRPPRSSGSSSGRRASQSTFGAIMIALDNGEPREFTLLQLLERFRDHRVEVIRRRSQHDLEKAQAERHTLEGLVAALGALDEVIAIIRGSADRGEASIKLQDFLGLSEVQAAAILDMRLARLTALEQDQLKKRLKELKAVIKELKGILKSESRKLEISVGGAGRARGEVRGRSPYYDSGR